MLPISHLCIIATDARIRSRISCIKFPFFFSMLSALSMLLYVCVCVLFLLPSVSLANIESVLVAETAINRVTPVMRVFGTMKRKR